MGTDKDREALAHSIRDYLDWIASLPSTNSHIKQCYSVVLNDFLSFVRNKQMVSKAPVTPDLSRFLSGDEKINRPVKIKGQQIPLPNHYEDYLRYQQHSRQASQDYLRQIRMILGWFHAYLKKHSISLSNLNIGHLDTFMAQFKVTQRTRKTYRHCLQGFLKYLYHQRRLIRKDLASQLVGPRLYAKSKPPKFLRPEEVKKLFASLKLSTPAHIRTYAMVHLTYLLGLRPMEISRITFDDISFSKAVLTLRDRKAHSPLTLPVSENVVKAIAAYVLKARPKSPDRHLFLSFRFPYRPMRPPSVCYHISKAMKTAGLPSTAYWLRHTYAQNLLQAGRSIYEIKEMLGHDRIDSTKVYLHIHIELMRKVLFNETL